MRVVKASIKDFPALYAVGKSTPELRVSATEDFMDADEFKWAITNPHGVFLVAKDGNKITGFVYANAKDIERPFQHKYACIVYIVVIPAYRRRGIAQKLYTDCKKKLESMGVTNLYGWANAEGNGSIVEFLKKNGFATGHKYIWMDKELK